MSVERCIALVLQDDLQHTNIKREILNFSIEELIIVYTVLQVENLIDVMQDYLKANPNDDMCSKKTIEYVRATAAAAIEEFIYRYDNEFVRCKFLALYRVIDIEAIDYVWIYSMILSNITAEKQVLITNTSKAIIQYCKVTSQNTSKLELYKLEFKKQLREDLLK